MVKISQKEAVFNAVTSVLNENGVVVSEGVNAQSLVTPEQRKQINAILFEGFRNRTIELDREFDDSALKGYVSGLQSNWLRKDKRLNGGISYIAKNPGSRAGSGDSQLKALRTLLSTVSTPEEKLEIQGYIDARVSEIQASKVKHVAIDYSALPADLAVKFAK
jgi:hypothetical protein